MGDVVTCLIWCDECCGENWEYVSARVRAGRASSRSGRLKVPVDCRGCGVMLLEGESAEAVTLHDGGGCAAWEDEYFEAGTVWQGQGRVQ